MHKEYYCPRCQSEDVIDKGETIHCLQCKLDFLKDILDADIDDENILAVQELEGFTESFEELKDKEMRKRFLKALKNDED